MPHFAFRISRFAFRNRFGRRTMILLLDNYDSFTYNLMQGLAQISGVPIEVVRNDVETVDELLARRPRAVVISPGPGIPRDAGVSMELIERATGLPLLGICLGHQALAAVHGGRVVRGREPVHGKTSAIEHRGAGLFEGVPKPFEATRYHSLEVDRESLPESLELTAWTEDGVVMGIAHRERPHFGLQFHPESYLCQEGMKILTRFVELAGIPVRTEWREGRDE
jgi:anthranilate synthase/aminodeoxychorismate synthase-like glutamine amidotransferase